MEKCKPLDVISSLPDENLVSILRWLSIREAAITGVLSHRWEHLWMYASRLDFDANTQLNALAQVHSEYESAELEEVKWAKIHKSERDKYVKWVNQVLNLYQGSMLEKFRVCFDLDNGNRLDIDKWLKCAFTRNVKRLEMDLATSSGFPNGHNEPYTLSAELFAQLKLLRSPHSDRCGPSSCANGLKFLKSLIFRTVNVTGEVLEWFLLNSPNIEQLVVLESDDLVNFEIAGSSPMLKHLEIGFCYNVESVKISDLNLVSLSFTGNGGVLKLRNLPSLIEVRYGATWLRAAIINLSSSLSQVQILSLHINNVEKNTKLEELPTLTRLKQLVLVVETNCDPEIMGFASLLKMSPCVERFVFQFQRCSFKPIKEMTEIVKPETCPHNNLRVVELEGYYGYACDLEAAIYILHNAVALEQLIIDPRDPSDVNNYGFTVRTPIDEEQIQYEEAARNRAKEQLEGRVPPYVKLSIL